MLFHKKFIFDFIFLISIGLFILSGCSHKETESKESGIHEIIRIKAMTLSEESVPVIEDIMGTVVSKDRAEVSGKIMGTIQSISVQEGDSVKAGQVLAKLDSRDLQPNVEKTEAGLTEIDNALNELDSANDELIAVRQAAQANFDYASTSLNRYQNLYNRQAISKDMLDETVRQYKLAEANLATLSAKKTGLEDKKKQLLAKKKQISAEQNLANVYLDYATIKAPISGFITKKYMDSGSMAIPGQPIFQIDSRDYQFEIELKESLFTQIKIGQKVDIIFDSISQKLEGTIVEIIPSSDPMTRTMTIKISLPKEDNLRSGLYGKAEFSLGTEYKLVIPSNAIVQQGSLTGVYALDSANITRYRLVKTGRQWDDRITILTGLKSGDRIVIEPMDKITEGMKGEEIQ